MSSLSYIAGIDVGTSKVLAVVARLDKDGRTDIVASGIAATRGIYRGVIVDMDAAARSIAEAVRMAERSSGVSVTKAHLGINGAHLECRRGVGTTALRGRFVTEDDMARVLESAASVYLPLDMEVLHALPSGYNLDGHGSVANPYGLSGRRLEANVRIVSVSESALRNLKDCVKQSGVETVSVMFTGLAAAYATLRPVEMRSGAALLDIGAALTTGCVFREGMLHHAFAIPVGGEHITNDIAVGLKLTRDEAERLKTMAGRAVPARNCPTEIEAVLSDGSTARIPTEYLVAIIRARVEEIFELAGADVRHSLYHLPATRVVVTGGTALLEGITKIAEVVFGLPVRVGAPDNAISTEHAEILGNPVFAGGVGIVLRAGSSAAPRPAVMDRGQRAMLRGSSDEKGVKRSPALPGFWNILQSP